jgi:hypothetical protein
MANVVEEITDDPYFCENDEFVYSPITRFCEIGLSSDWTASPGRPSRGSVSEACLPASESLETLSGIPVALAIVYEV